MPTDYTLPHCGIPAKHRLKYGAILLVYMCIAVFLTSRDNPWLHSPYVQHVDSAMFFMGGKAWANGLTPYVDFTDSKGPLLWLIHMVAYFISYTSYLGIMVMIAPVMAGALYFSWLTAVRITGNERLGLWAAAPMPLVWFLTLQFIETRAETYAQLPMAYLLYVMVTGMRSPGLLTPAKAFWSGVSLAALLLIKWSFVAYGGILVLAQLICIAKFNWQLTCRYLAWGIAGVLVCCAPFVVYLLCAGAFDAFIHEYFVNTLATTGIASGDKNIVTSFWEHLSLICKDIKTIIPLLAIIFGNIIAFRRFPSLKWLPSSAIGLIIIMVIATMLWPYYVQILGFAAISFFACAAVAIKTLLRGTLSACFERLWPLALLCCLLPGIRICVLGSELHRADYTPNYKELADVAIKQWCDSNGIKSPQIIYVDGLDFGLGVSTQAIPGGKHWFRQFGSTEEMDTERRHQAKAATADILVVFFEHTADPSEYGYTQIFSAEVPREAFSRMRVYARSVNK